MKKINVLITHVSYQASAGGFIKMLRNSNIFDCYIIGCDSIKKGFSSGSMLVDKFYHVQYSPRDIQYIKSIQAICLNENIDLIISAEEEDLIVFKKNKIPQAFYQYIIDLPMFDLFKDKHLANVDMCSNGIHIPKTLTNSDEYKTSKKNKFILRKRISCSSRGIKILHRNEIDKNHKFFTKEYITQEFIEGDLYTIDVLCNKYGKAQMIVPRQILSSKDGTTFKCIIRREESLIKICEKIYSIYCIPGISNIQFIIEKNYMYFIELNPRAAGTLIASSLVSNNFLDLYISHFFLNEELSEYEKLMDAVRWNSIISRYYQETIMFGV